MRKSGPSARYRTAVQLPHKTGSAGGNGRGNFLRLSETSPFVALRYPFNSLPAEIPQESFVGRLPIKSSVRSMVIIVVLPLTKPVCPKALTHSPSVIHPW